MDPMMQPLDRGNSFMALYYRREAGYIVLVQRIRQAGSGLPLIEGTHHWIVTVQKDKIIEDLMLF